MTFNVYRFTDQITEITDMVYKMRKICRLSSRPNELAYLNVAAPDVAPDYSDYNSFTLNGYPDYDLLSSHERLALSDYETRIVALGLEIIDNIAVAAPVLAAQDLRAGIRFAARSRKGPQISMALMDLSLCLMRGKRTPEEIGECLQVMCERLKDLPLGARLFRINDTYDIQANAPEDAYQIYAAIALPGLFEPGNTKCRSPVLMSEIFDTRQFSLI